MNIPKHLADNPLGIMIIDILSSNPLFKERPKKGNALLIDYSNCCNQPSRAIYNSNTWQQIPKNPDQLTNLSYALIIFVLPSLIEKEDLAKLIEENKKRLNLDGGEISIFEELAQPMTGEEKKD